MGLVDQSEETVSGLYKSAPSLSESGREWFVKALPWISLVFGLFQLIGAYWLWQLTHVTAAFKAFINSLNVSGANIHIGLSVGDKLVIYLAAVVLIIDGILLLMAFPKLKLRTKKGWELLFLGTLLNLLYAVVALFVHNRGIGASIESLLGSAISFYILFQVKGKYTKAGIPPAGQTIKK